MTSQDSSMSTGGMKESLVKRLYQISYFLFGERIEERLPQESKEALKIKLRKAGIGVQAVLYLSIAATLTAVFSVLSISTAVLFVTLGLAGFPAIVFSLLLSIVFGVSFWIGPSMLAKQRKADINQNLHYALNHMAITSSSGLPPSDVFRSLGEAQEYGEISVEAKKIIRRTEVLGDSIDESIEKSADFSPSKEWGSMLKGLTYTVQGGGDLKQFLDEQAEEAMTNFESRWSQAIEKLGMVSEVYTITAIIFPIVAVIMFSLLATMGALPINGMLLLEIMVYGVLPTINIFFLLGLEIVIPEMK